MNNKNWRDWAYILMIFGCIQFLILTVLAMIFYAGGTAVNPNAPGYSFWSNFFSDTGRTKAWSGKENTISYIIFTVTLTTIGVILIPFYLAFKYIFNESAKEKKRSKIGSLFGIITGIFFIFTAFTPYDIFFNEHFLSVLILFTTLLVSTVIYTIVMISRKSYPHLYSYTYLTFLVILCVYYVIFLSILFGGPNIDTTEGLTIQATAQKIVVYSFNFCHLIQGYGARKYAKLNP